MNIGIRADMLETSEFEKFAVEIVKRKFKSKAFHGFPDGKDDGIDGIDDMSFPSLILQAKRWQIRKSQGAAVKLLKDEIDKLSNTRLKYKWECSFHYVIVTSLGLSPENLKEIREYADKRLGILPSDDYIISESTLTTLSQDKEFKDIFENYGLIEKNLFNLLNREKLNNIEIESRNYFLDFDFNYFAETSFLGEAYSILKRKHILLIHGPAGIGKTTTCTMLGNIFNNNVENHFDIIVRKIEDISDTLKLYNSLYRDSEKKNLFVVFDDFLGRNKFDVGERMLQDIGILYSASKNSKNLFICLNSRTQILQNAKEINYEFQKLINEKFTEEKNFIIDLSRYSAVDKAHIFRKTFEQKISLLQNDEKKALSSKYNQLRNKNWSEIINHRNYFPRSVELIVNNFEESTTDFFNFVIFYLDHPTQLYDNLFENLNREEKYLLFSLLSFDSLPIFEEWIGNTLNCLNLDPTFNFEKSLNKLNGSWITYVKKDFKSQNQIIFFNPSIVDFLNDKIKKYPKIDKEINDSSVYLHQFCKHIEEIFINISQSLKSHGNFLGTLLKNWEKYKDKSDFVGEKLLMIICLDKYKNYKLEFQKLLLEYGGELYSMPYLNGWEFIIRQIYYSNNYELKELFLDNLENIDIIQNILDSPGLDSENLDSIADNINNIIKDITLFSSYYASNFKELDFYSEFSNKKISLLQDYIDDADTVYDEDIILPNNYDEFDLSFEVSQYSSQFINSISEMIVSTYKWENIDVNKLDYSELEYNLESHIQDEYETQYQQEDEYDKLREYQRECQREEKETIESILDKSLL